ncbi:MAG: hypothetical protein CME71_02985 [Halobacteriovorax sp.]|nr:hypothetical protein [Halobacteriovorax sp.]|tara:strand:- start:2201 stop:2440 length:240 start_codon:yes stop_codon:yes gene_type:complete
MTTSLKIKIALSLVLLSSLVIFFAQNDLRIDIKFLFFDILEAHLLSVISVFTLIGCIIGSVITYAFMKKKNVQNFPGEL